MVQLAADVAEPPAARARPVAPRATCGASATTATTSPSVRSRPGRSCAHSPGHPGAAARARRGGRHHRCRADPEPRHDRRQHLQRLPGRRLAAHPAGRGRHLRPGLAWPGERSVPAREFWTAYRQTALRPDELLLRVRFPVERGRHTRFRKVGGRAAQAICKVVMALSYREDGPTLDATCAWPWGRSRRRRSALHARRRCWRAPPRVRRSLTRRPPPWPRRSSPSTTFAPRPPTAAP